jgi:hypothetical protein
MAFANLKYKTFAPFFGTIANTLDFQAAAKAIRNTNDHVVQQRSGQSMLCFVMAQIGGA